MQPGADGDIFDEFTEDIGKQVFDMYFHTVNFWRECVSAFVSQNDANIRKKVLTRLTEIIRFETNIRDLLKMSPDDYTPPICQFLTTNGNMVATVAKFKKPTGELRSPPPRNLKYFPLLILCFSSAPAKKARKKASPKAQNISTTVVGDTENIPTTATAADEMAIDQITGRAQQKTPFDNQLSGDFYRSLDPNVMQLFEENLILKYPLTQETTGTALGLLEFK